MTSWLKTLFLLSTVGFTACAHDGAGSEAAPSSSIESLCAEVSQIICTREYLPTSCSMGQQQFTSSNPCEAKKLAKAYACEKRLPYVDEQVKCESKTLVQVDAEDDECGSERKACTREFKPQICRFGEVAAKGDNHCEALNTLRTTVCSKKIPFSASEASCEAININDVPKIKRSR